jgi:hypothetical protein
VTRHGRWVGAGCLAALAFVASVEEIAHAEDQSETPEHTIILGIGGAAELELGDGSVHPGGNVMVEWDAIENWLEFEVGVSVLAADGGVEVPIDLLVKKPFGLTRWAEFMVAVGPEVVPVSNPTTRTTYFGGEFALDFMFWPWGRRFGLWFEPEYDLVFHSGVSQGVGTTGGLLIGW